MLRPPVVAAFTAALTAAAAVTGCHGTSSGHPAATSSAVKADETQAAQILNQCTPKNVLDLTSKSGRDAFGKCLEISPAKRPAFSSCLTTAAQADHVLTKAGRAEFTEVSLPKCVRESR